MRILSFSHEWVDYTVNRIKWENDFFTTWRFPRRDKDWQVNETVQVWFKSRSPNRRFLCQAQILAKTTRHVDEPDCITYLDALHDGFKSQEAMYDYLEKTHGERLKKETINKLYLKRL